MYRRSFITLRCDDSTLCNYGWKLAADHPKTVVRFARGRKMRTASGLFDEISAACQFPYYFGENWAGFAECLGDLSWINASKFVLIISGFEQVLADDLPETGAFARSLKSAIGEYNKAKRVIESEESAFQLLINSPDGLSNGPKIDGEIGSPEVLRLA